MEELNDSPVPKLITTFHPTLSARSVRSVSELYPEEDHGPGSIEYELTADFLRRSMSSMTNSSVIRGNSTHEFTNAQPSSSRITVQIPPEFRRSVRSISAELQKAGEKTRPMTFFGLDISEDTYMSISPQNSNSLPRPLSIEKEALEEDLNGRNNVGNIEKTDAGFGSYRIPRGSLYFLFGFLFMPVWWYGAIFPKHTDLKVDLRWRSYNRMMSIISVIILAIGLGMLIWFLSK